MLGAKKILIFFVKASVVYKIMREGGGGGKFLNFFGQKLIFLIDLKSQKQFGQSDKPVSRIGGDRVNKTISLTFLTGFVSKSICARL